MRTTIFLMSLLWLQAALATTPILESGVAGLSSDDSIQSSRAKLESRCEEFHEVTIEPPSFPLAKDSEVHLICRNFSVDTETVGAIALTFADEKLVMIYARGNAAGMFLGFSSEPVQDYLQFSAAFKELLVVDRASDQVWLLNQPEVQQQVDCFGFEFAGFPRKIEAVFGDGILEQAWILTGQGEEGRVRDALIAEYGEPTFVNEQWEVFHNKRVMLRKDKPEVLMLSEKLADLFYDEEID